MNIYHIVATIRNQSMTHEHLYMITITIINSNIKKSEMMVGRLT